MGYEGPAGHLNVRLRKLIHEALDILGAGKALSEASEPEAVVNALLEHTAQPLLTLNDEHARTVFMSRKRRSKSGRAAAYNDNIMICHFSAAPFLLSKTIGDSSELFLTSVSSTPRYSAIICVTRGEQKPP